MKTRSLFARLIPLLLVLCMVFTGCVNMAPGTPEESTTDNGTTPTPGGDTTAPPNTNTDPTPCTHAQTQLRNQAAATCGADGYTGDTVCSTCGELITKGTVIAATGEHTWNSGVVTKNPTCIATGILTKTCTVCFGETESTLATVEHDNKYHDALDGTHSHTCGTCTDVNSFDQHVPVDAGTYYEATCQYAGYTEYVCALCNGRYKVVNAEDPIKSHNWTAWATTAATCGAEGQQIRTCQNDDCTEVERIVLPVNSANHTFEWNSTVDATCEAEGKEIYICSNTSCAAPKEVILPKKAHNLQTDTNEAATTGWTHQYCTNCDYKNSTYDASDLKVAEVTTADIPADKPFEIQMETAKIEFPPEVISQMKENTNIEIKADTIGDDVKANLIEQAGESLTQDEKNRLNDVEVYDFSAGSVSDDFAASVKVTLTYELKNGEDPEAIVIWYVNDSDPNNVVLEKKSAVYDAETKSVTFEVTHFSYYAIAYEETQEMRCRRGLHAHEVKDVIQATCYNYGYTVRECGTCHDIMLDSHVEKLAHSFGPVINPHVTCDQGGHKTQSCTNANCGYTLVLDYVRALGHTPDQVASCDEASTCTRCQNVLSPALGHNMTEWEIVIEPTEITAGLRRRHCSRCGHKEEGKLAATGGITPIKFESFQELAETLLFDTLGFGNGSVKFSTAADGTRIDCTITVNEADGSYTMLVDGTYSYLRYTPDQEGVVKPGYGSDSNVSVSPLAEQIEEGSFTALYRNGILVISNVDGDEMIGVTDIDSIMSMMFNYMSLDTIKAFLEDAFDFVNPTVEATYAQATAMVNDIIDQYGDRIDKALALAGLTYTAEDLKGVLTSVETLYTYAALKLGFNTNLEINGDVTIPTAADLATVLGAFCTTTTDANGNITYEIDGKTEFEKAMDVVFTWCDTHMEMTLDVFLYEVLGETIVASYPELTSWAAVEDYIKTKFPATLTIGEVTDRIIAAIEATELCTAEEFYSLLNAVLRQYLPPTDENNPGSGDIKAMIDAYAEMTLDALCQEAMGCTLDEFYAQLSQMLSTTTLGSMPISVNSETSVPLSEMVAMMKQYLEMFSINALGFKLTMSEAGELLYYKAEESISLTVDVDAEGTPITQDTDFSIEIDKLTNVTVQIPDSLQGVNGQKVTYTYDANGNLIVSGLNPDVDYTVSIQGGNQDVAMKDLATLDKEMSDKLGYNVYVLNESLWNSSTTIARLLLGPDGKYYNYHHNSTYKTNITGTVALAKIIADYTVLLPVDGQETDGTFGEFPVYKTVIGNIFCDAEGVWQLISDEYSSFYTEHVYDNNHYKGREIYIYDSVLSVSLESAAASLEISNFESNYQNIYDENGNVLERISRVYLYINAFEDAMVQIETEAIFEGDDMLLVKAIEETYDEYYVLDGEVTELPAYDNMSAYYISYAVRDENGNPLSGAFQQAYLYKKVPTYYVEYDGRYFSNYTSMFQNISNISALAQSEYELADGRILYVLGNETVQQVNGSTLITHALVGYIHVSGNRYIPALCFFSGEEEVEIRYLQVQYGYVDYNNNGMTHYYYGAGYDSIISDLGVTRDDNGNYIIPAATLATLREQLDRDAESFAFLFTAVYENANGQSVSEAYVVGLEGNEAELPWINDGNNSSFQPYLELNKYFPVSSSSDSSNVSVNKEEDGSLSFTLLNGEKITLDIRLNGAIKFPVDPAQIELDEAYSAKYGLPVYQYNRYGSSYVNVLLYNGAYYSHNDGGYYYRTMVTGYTEQTIEAILQDYYIENMYLFIPMTETEAPIYSASIRWNVNTPWWYSSVDLYIQVIDGQLYVLTGMEQISDSIVQYEGKVLLSEYIDSLTYTVDTNGGYGTFGYLTDDTTPVLIKNVFLYEGDKQLTSLPLTFVGDQTICVISTESAIVIDSSKPCAKPDFFKNEHSYVSEYYNGKFNFVSGYVLFNSCDRYIEIGGNLYHFDYSEFEPYNYFEANRMTERDFAEKALSKTHLWFTEDSDGNVIYYNYVEYDYDMECWVASEPMTDVSVDDWYFPETYYVGTDANGLEIYEIDGYLMDLTCEVVGDNLKFYPYSEGMTSGYLEITTPVGARYYVEAEWATNNDGEEVLFCTNIVLGEYYYLNDVEAYLLLSDYMTVSGSTATLSADFFALFGDYGILDVYIEVRYQKDGSSYYAAQISGQQLWNALNPGTSSDNNSSNNNGSSNGSSGEVIVKPRAIA